MASPPDPPIQILEISRVGPPPNSVTQSSLPLNYFDVFCLPGPAVKHNFYYESIHSKSHFIDTIIPKLKTSLSLTLQIFYPLAGNVTNSPDSPTQLELRYQEGDSIELTVAESGAEFNYFVQNSPRDVNTDHPLAPDIPQSDPSVTPVLALQVTHFPGSGICIGLTTHHIAADFRSCIQFMKSWASISRLGSIDPNLIPVFDRSEIKDPTGLYSVFYNQWMKFIGEMGAFEVKERSRVDSVLSTFVLKRGDLERLRRSVSAKRGGGEKSVPSSFAATCGYVWACLVKSRRYIGPETEHFVFAADFRARLEPPLPEAFFGNCIATNFVEAKGSDLGGENGIMVASEAIGSAVMRLGDGVFKGAEDWIPKLDRIKGNMFAVAGSPIFRVYDTDFGWGKAKKVEMVSMRDTNAMFFTENKNEEGGVAFDLARPKDQMDAFASVFEESLKGDLEKNHGASASHSVFYRTSSEILPNRRTNSSPVTSSFFSSNASRRYSTTNTGFFPAISSTRRYSTGITSLNSTISGSIGISDRISTLVSCYPSDKDKDHTGNNRIYAEQGSSLCRENLHRHIGYFWHTFRHVLALNRGRRLGSFSALDF